MHPVQKVAGRVEVSAVIFSHCGTSIAISFPGRPWPTLKALPDWLVDANDRKRGIPDSGTHIEKKRKVLSRDSGVQSLLSLEPANLPANMTSSTVILDRHVSGTQVTILSTGTETRQVSICRENGSVAKSVPVMTLPSYLPDKFSAAYALSQPSSELNNQNRSEFIKLILTPSPQMSCDSDEVPPSKHLPLVVRKDVRALYKSQAVPRHSGHIDPSQAGKMILERDTF